MTTKLTFMVPVGLILAACAPQSFVVGNCDIVTIKPCTGNPPAVNINTNAKTVAPPKYCIGPGGTVTFKVTPVDGGVKTVATIPKDLSQFWMIATNDPDQNSFELTAPSTKGDYDYFVVFKDGHCIDPRISVE